MSSAESCFCEFRFICYYLIDLVSLISIFLSQLINYPNLRCNSMSWHMQTHTYSTCVYPCVHICHGCDIYVHVLIRTHRWLDPLFWTGCRRGLTLDDLYAHPGEVDSKMLLNKFNRYLIATKYSVKTICQIQYCA